MVRLRRAPARLDTPYKPRSRPSEVALKRRTALVSSGAGLALLGAAAWYLWPSPPTTPDWAGDYDVTARPPETIPPGTVVGDSPPDGWTHLVIKSLPRVRPGEESRIPRIAR